LIGNANISITAGSVYNDTGATCSDAVDGIVHLSAVGSVNTATPGTYTLTYDYTDAANNAATQVTRTVQVTPAPNAAYTSSGGGCTINNKAAFDPSMLIMLVLAGGFLLRKRKYS